MIFDRRAFIEKKLPHLVKSAEDFLRDNRIYLLDEDDDPLVSGTQLRNLLAAAQGGSPIPILRNFLHYQMSRERNAWSDRKSGEALIKLLEVTVEKPIEELKLANEDERYQLEAKLAAQLLGFLSREYTYQLALQPKVK